MDYRLASNEGYLGFVGPRISDGVCNVLEGTARESLREGAVALARWAPDDRSSGAARLLRSTLVLRNLISLQPLRAQTAEDVLLHSWHGGIEAVPALTECLQELQLVC